MRKYILLIIGLLLFGVCLQAAPISDCMGIIRCFGENRSWVSNCFVVGDGSWVITTLESISEKTSPTNVHQIRTPVFISPITGEAYECKVVATDSELDAALLKLPISGLPAAAMAVSKDYTKVRFGTMGELMLGEPIGNKWQIDIYGINRKESKDIQLLGIEKWNSEKAFAADVDKYKLLFISEITPADKLIPNGALAAKENTCVGMYLSKMVFSGGKTETIFGRVSPATELGRFMVKNGIDSSLINETPAPKLKKDKNSEKAFQLYASIYTMFAMGRADETIAICNELVKLRPESAQSQMTLGIALARANKIEDSLKAYDAALKINPKLPNLRNSRALVLKDPKEVEAELIKASEESPSDIRPVMSLVDFYMQDEKTYNKALKYANRAVSLERDNPNAFIILAKAQKLNKDYTGAISSLNKALEMVPNWKVAWYGLGATYEASGDKVNAEKAYRKMVDIRDNVGIQNISSNLSSGNDSLGSGSTDASDYMILASFLIDNNNKTEAKSILAKAKMLTSDIELINAIKELEKKAAE